MAYKNWTQEDEQYLFKNYPNTDNEILSKHFDVSIKGVISKASSLNIKKSDQYISKKRTEEALNRGKKDVHAAKIEFGNSLDGDNFTSILPLFKKHGKDQLNKLYRLHTA